jgi:hypothetical protein
MNELIDNIKALASSQQQLAQQALLQYKPLVEQYISQKCTDSNQIAHTLDYILDFCFDEQMLLLYRHLCRHLYSFDPSTATDYVNAYREMWDEEGKQFGNNDKECEK